MFKNFTPNPSSTGISTGAMYIFVVVFTVLLHRTGKSCLITWHNWM